MTSLLDEQVQGQDGILDVFRTRRIEQGVGEQWVTIRADATHGKVRKKNKRFRKYKFAALRSFVVRLFSFRFWRK